MIVLSSFYFRIVLLPVGVVETLVGLGTTYEGNMLYSVGVMEKLVDLCSFSLRK